MQVQIKTVVTIELSLEQAIMLRNILSFNLEKAVSHTGEPIVSEGGEDALVSPLWKLLSETIIKHHPQHHEKN